jgi:hypothetical protein
MYSNLTHHFYFLFKKVIFLKGTVQQDCLPWIILRMSFFHAPYSVSEAFLNMASNLGKYSRFLIDSLLLFRAESFDTPHIIYYGVLRLLATFTRGVPNAWIFCRSSGLLFNVGSRYSSYCLINTERHWSKKFIYARLALLTGNILKESKIGVA